MPTPSILYSFVPHTISAWNADYLECIYFLILRIKAYLRFYYHVVFVCLLISYISCIPYCCIHFHRKKKEKMPITIYPSSPGLQCSAASSAARYNAVLFQSSMVELLIRTICWMISAIAYFAGITLKPFALRPRNRLGYDISRFSEH